MNITLKNIKHAEFASQETNCFEATVYVDGKRTFKVSNDGHGGCDNYHPLKADGQGYKTMREHVDAINAELKKIPLTGDFASLTNDLEIIVGDLLTEWLIAKDIKKTLKKLCYITGDGKVYISNAKLSEASIISIQKTTWWTPNHKVLNGLPMDEVRQYFN